MMIPMILGTIAEMEDEIKPAKIAETICIINPITVTMIVIIRAHPFPFNSP